MVPDLATQPPPPLPEGNLLPSLEELHSTYVPTVKWCPKAARGDLARELSSLWLRMSENPQEVRLWALEAMFPRCILPAGRGPRAGDVYSQARIVRDRLRRWRAGEYAQLWREAVDLTKVPPKKKKKNRGGEEKTQEKRNAERAATLAEDAQFTKALQALTSAGMAPPTPANVKTMKEKHPEARVQPAPLPTTEVPQLSFSQVEVDKAVKKFRRGSAPGPSGLRPEHVKSTLQAAPGRRDKALQSLTRLVNVMVKGEVPTEIAPFLSGARLHAANKKDGGIRPIAIGNLLRRLVAKCCASKLQDKAAAVLGPHQLGVGVPGACEGIVHTVRKLLEADPSLFCLQVDLVNAFNLVNRDAAMEAVLQNFPEVLAWVKTCYGQPSHLLFGLVTLSSQLGFQQGDPLASLLFSLVLQSVVNLISERVPDLSCHAWFLDDGTMVGKVEDLRAAVDILLEEGPALGLTLSSEGTVRPPASPKSSIWCPNLTPLVEDPTHRGLQPIQGEGIVLLGSPIGSPLFVEGEIKKKIDKVEEITNLLPLLEDPHTEYVLLKSCLSLPKLSFLLRTINTIGFSQHLQRFDRITKEALTRILGTPMDPLSWQQAKLPVPFGGLGLRSAVDQAPAAYTASLLASQPIGQSLMAAPQLPDHPEEGAPDQPEPGVLDPPTLAALSAALGKPVVEAEVEGLTQKMLTLMVDQQQLNLLHTMLDDQDVRERSRLASLSLPHAGDWLHCAPIKTLGLHLRPLEFTLAVKYRLGLPIYPSQAPCPACLKLSDVKGDHALCCGVGSERISRHNALRDAIFLTASNAGLSPVKEGRFLLPGADRRPADVLLPHWTGGQDTALDITVTCSLQEATVDRQAIEPGYAVNLAHDRKLRGAEEDCRRQGLTFLPLAVETLGGWHPVAETQIKKLGSCLSLHSGQDQSETTAFLWRRLSLLVQKGNTAILANRTPSYPEPHIGGQL